MSKPAVGYLYAAPSQSCTALLPVPLSYNHGAVKWCQLFHFQLVLPFFWLLSTYFVYWCPWCVLQRLQSGTPSTLSSTTSVVPALPTGSCTTWSFSKLLYKGSTIFPLTVAWSDLFVFVAMVHSLPEYGVHLLIQCVTTQCSRHGAVSEVLPVLLWQRDPQYFLCRLQCFLFCFLRVIFLAVLYKRKGSKVWDDMKWTLLQLACMYTFNMHFSVIIVQSLYFLFIPKWSIK